MWKNSISFSAPVNNREKGEYRREAGEQSAPPQPRGVGAESAVGFHVAANDLEARLTRTE
jgi:hypothetical protein